MDKNIEQDKKAEITNIWAYAALACALIGFTNGITFLIAIILGHLALSKCKHEGQNGKKIAITALIISYGAYGCVVLFWLLLITYVIFF